MDDVNEFIWYNLFISSLSLQGRSSRDGYVAISGFQEQPERNISRNSNQVSFQKSNVRLLCLYKNSLELIEPPNLKDYSLDLD